MIGRLRLGQRQRGREPALGLGIATETMGGLGLGLGVVALGIQRRLAALGEASVSSAPASRKA